MARLGWIRVKDVPTGRDSVVLGSRLELRRFRHLTGFLVAAVRIRRQVRRSPGALGVSLIAHPTRRTFWTLSAWEDQESLDDFVRTAPHSQVMERFHARLAQASFTTWNVPTKQLPEPRSAGEELWREVERRLAATRADTITV